MTTTTDLIQPSTITEMAETYVAAEKKIRIAYELLAEAQSQLRASFGDGNCRFSTVIRDNTSAGKEGADHVMAHIKQDAWYRLVERLELRRVMSSSRVRELDDQLAKSKGLPEITAANLMAWLEKSFSEMPSHFDGMVKEVFDFLRPRRSGYKTNSEFEIGPKVILWGITSNYKGGYFNMNSYRQQDLTSLDNVFRILDGKGAIKTYNGPTYDSMYAALNQRPLVWPLRGETEYFFWKLFKNGNGHLEFRRQDLLDKLNSIGGGKTLHKATTEATQNPNPKNPALLTQ